jgi:hypothetical protein
MNRFVSKIQRLRSMSNHEISYRAREACRKQVDRLQFWLRLGRQDHEFDNMLATYTGSLKGYLESVASRRFYPSLFSENRKDTIRLLEQATPGSTARTLEEAEWLCAHRMNLLAYSSAGLGEDISWHRDPVSGHKWIKRFWADYDLVRDGSADAKVIHELNRHQHLPRLAKAFLITGDERFAREAVSQMESWIEQNERWNGVNWHSSLEIAIRTLSWMWTIFMLLPSRSLDEPKAQQITRSLFQQIDHVHRYPSTYSSPNTHLIGEGTALFIAGLVFQELPRAAKWREKGASILVDSMQRQVLQDGVYFELSSYYHCYATDFFLQAVIVARSLQLPVPKWMWTRLEGMIEFVANLTRPDGTLPLLGDDDGGRALALASEHYGSYLDGVCNGAVLYNRGDFKHVAGSFKEETLWLLGPDAWRAFNDLSAQQPSRLSYSCAEAGYFVQRSGWKPTDTHIVFDCGGHGTISGHAHADALSISLFSGQTELLVDPATSVYNCAPEWRNFFRSTSAHNTVVVDGADQSLQAGTFKWSKKAESRIIKHLPMADLEFIEGEHDGYTRLRTPITHKRRLLYVRPNYWIIADDLSGHGEHTFDFIYHFAPGSKLFVFGEEQNGEIDCRARLNQAALQMSLFATAPMHAEALCGQIAPIQGWTSSRYGERKPAPVFKGTVRGFAPVGALAFLVPGTGTNLRTRRLNISGGRSLSAVVRDGIFEDICVSSTDSSAELHLMDFSMAGEFFWLRTENGALRRLLAVNALSFAISGEVIFRSQSPISHVMVHVWENGMVIEHGEEEGKVYVRDLRDRQFQSN